MDGARLNDLIYRGMGKAAAHIGRPCAVFRPQNPTAPLTNQVETLPIAFNAANPAYTKPQLYGKAVWFADMDATHTRPGDYLVRLSDDKIWYIAAQQQLLPVVAIECNRRIRVVREQPQTAVGELPYSGIIEPADVLGTEDSLWPCSILQGGKPLPAAGLPSDVKDAGWKILLPISAPIRIQSADLIEDDIGRGFAVGSAELTDLGWRLEVNETHT
jgi:hypothetical protein